MSMVDFSNAKIEVASGYTKPPIATNYVNLYATSFRDSSGQEITSNGTRQILINESKRLVLTFTGVFTASGTEFYIYSTTGSPAPAKWRVYDVSFQSGDTYSFEIPITLTCL